MSISLHAMQQTKHEVWFVLCTKFIHVSDTLMTESLQRYKFLHTSFWNLVYSYTRLEVFSEYHEQLCLMTLCSALTKMRYQCPCQAHHSKALFASSFKYAGNAEMPFLVVSWTDLNKICWPCKGKKLILVIVGSRHFSESPLNFTKDWQRLEAY